MGVFWGALRDAGSPGHHVQPATKHTKVPKGRNAAERIDHGRVRRHGHPWPTGGLHHQGHTGSHPEPEGGRDTGKVFLLLGEL